MVEQKVMSKKKRFRPRKLIRKLFGKATNKDALGNATNSPDPAEDYEPPSPVKIALDPMIGTTITTSSESTCQSSVSPMSIKDVSRRSVSSPSSNLDVSNQKLQAPSPKQATVRDVIQGLNVSRTSSPSPKSKDDNSWGEFPPAGTDDAPFDEEPSRMKAFQHSIVFADSLSNGDIAVDVIYEDLEQSPMKEQNVDGIPRQITLKGKPWETDTEYADSALSWVVMSDGTLEMREAPDMDEDNPTVKHVPTVGKTNSKDSELVSVVSNEQKPKLSLVANLETKNQKSAQSKTTEVKKVDPPATGDPVLKKKSSEASTVLEKIRQRRIQGDGQKKKNDPPDQFGKKKEESDPINTLVLEQKPAIPERKTQNLRETRKIEPMIQEEKKEEDGDSIIYLIPKVPVQKARTTSPVPTVSNIADLRRISSLSTSVKFVSSARNHTNTKQDPAIFVSQHSFMAVPEVGEDITSLDGSYVMNDSPVLTKVVETEEDASDDARSLGGSHCTSTSNILTQVIETDEGTEMLSTFSSTYPSLIDDNDVESDSNLLLEYGMREEHKESTMHTSCPQESVSSSLKKIAERTRSNQEGSHDSLSPKEEKMLRKQLTAAVSNEIAPEATSASPSTDPINTSDVGSNVKSQSSKLGDGQPRRIMGRSRESVEAEQVHGSLTPDIPLAPIRRGPTLWSPYSFSYDAEDADDEMGLRSVVSAPGTETDASSYASSSFVRSGDDGSYADDNSNTLTVNSRRSDYLSDYTDDEGVAGNGVNLTSELTEMAAELRDKGPAVLMDWLDLR